MSVDAAVGKRYEQGMRMHRRGRTAPALQLLRQAAEAGHPAAMAQLARLLVGQQRRRDEVLGLLRRAVEAGDPAEVVTVEARWNLAMVLARGRPPTGEAADVMEQARTGWEAAAGAGDLAAGNAAFGLSGYFRVIGDERRQAEWERRAEAAYRTAAGHGDAEARIALADLLADVGRPEEAEHWWRVGAAAKDDLAMYRLGSHLVNDGRTQAGLRWLRRSARRGNALGMGGVAQVHVDEDRIGRATWWLRAAARLGNPAAMNDLGILLKRQGSYISAAHWYRRADEAGNPHAAYNLRVLHQDAGRFR